MMHKIKWTVAEINHLIDGLNKRASLTGICIALPQRTRGTVLHKANKFNYGHDTDSYTGEVYFRHYIKYRKRRTKQEIEMEIQNGRS